MARPEWLASSGHPGRDTVEHGPLRNRAGTDTGRMARQAKTAIGYLAVITPLIWGTTYLTTTQFLPPDRPLLAATVRALPAGIILVAGRKLPPRGWRLRYLVLSILYVSAFFPLLFVAAYRLPGGVASVINSLSPIGVVLLSVAWLGTTLRAVHIAAGIVGVAGVALLVLTSSARLDFVGIAAMTTGVAMMVVATVLTKKWGRPPGVGPLEFTGWTFLLGGLVLLPFMLLIEGLPTHLTARNVAGYLYVIVFGAVISYSLWFWCLERLPASAASFLSLINPVFAAILGWIVLDQSLNGTQLFGAVLVLVSVALGQAGALGRRPAGCRCPVGGRHHRHRPHDSQGQCQHRQHGRRGRRGARRSAPDGVAVHAAGVGAGGQLPRLGVPRDGAQPTEHPRA